MRRPIMKQIGRNVDKRHGKNPRVMSRLGQRSRRDCDRAPVYELPRLQINT